MPRKPLTPKQEAFVREYLVDLNATQAAVRAGYSAKTAKVQGARLLTYADIADAVAEAKAQRAERIEVTADYVLRNLTEVVERCMQRAPVMGRAAGEVVHVTDEHGRHVWQFDAKGANGALNLLGQHLGLYTKKLEHAGPGGAAIPVALHITHEVVDPAG